MVQHAFELGGERRVVQIGVHDRQAWLVEDVTHDLPVVAESNMRLLAFDIAHGVGNVVFFLAFGPALVRVLRRYRARLEVRWTPAPPILIPTPQDPPR